MSQQNSQVWNSWRDIEGRGENCEGRPARGDQRGENCEGRIARARGERRGARGEGRGASVSSEMRELSREGICTSDVQQRLAIILYLRLTCVFGAIVLCMICADQNGL